MHLQICLAFDCDEDNLAIFTDCTFQRDCPHHILVDHDNIKRNACAETIETRKGPCKRKIGFFTTKMEAFKYANDVPVEEASVTVRSTMGGDKSGLVSRQSIASIWSSLGHSNADISGIDESALSRLAVAVDDHLLCVLDRCLSSAYDRLNFSATVSHHSLLSNVNPVQQQQRERDRQLDESSDKKQRECSDDRIFLQPILRHRNQRPSVTSSAAEMHTRWFEDVNVILYAETAAARSIVQNRGIASSNNDQAQAYQHLLKRRVDRAFLERDNSNGLKSKASKVKQTTALSSVVVYVGLSDLYESSSTFIRRCLFASCS